MIKISPTILAEFENDLFRLHKLLNNRVSDFRNDDLWFIGNLTSKLYAHVYVLDKRSDLISPYELLVINDLKIELLCEYVEAVRPKKGWDADIWDRLANIESQDKAQTSRLKIH